MSDNPPKSYRTPGAATYLNTTKSWLDKRAHFRDGGPPFRRVGRLRIYDEPDLEAYKRQTRVDPNKQHTT